MSKAKAEKDNLKIALFCGGTGTRLWPMSRRDKPKQFQPLVGKESMFEQMINRLRKGFDIKDIFVVTGRMYVKWVVEQAQDLPLENIIIEPEMRDTLAAVGLAAIVLNRRFSNPKVAALWGADHLVRNEQEFLKALKVASQVAAREGKIVEVDVRPTFPSVHLGYIQIGKMLEKIDGLAVFEFVRQVEKPDLEAAKKFTQSWEYLWHVGYSVWQAQTMLDHYKKLAPAAAKSLTLIDSAFGKPNYEEVLKREYPKIGKTSFDFAILEKFGPGDQLVVSADLGWADIGAWNILKDELADSSKGNVLQGLVIDDGSKDCLIYGPADKVIATLGLNNLIVVDTPDALLICPKEKAAEVKKIVERLKEKGITKFL